MKDDALARALASLWLFRVLLSRIMRTVDPAAVLLDAIDRDDLDNRVRDGLPWIPRACPDLNWDWLAVEAQRRNRQNRLGFIVALAALSSPYLAVHEKLIAAAKRIAEISRDEYETLCKASTPKADRAFLRSLLFPIPEFWRIDSDLELVVHACHRIGQSFEVSVERWQIMPLKEVCGHLKIRPGDLVRLTLTKDGVLMTTEKFVRPAEA